MFSAAAAGFVHALRRMGSRTTTIISWLGYATRFSIAVIRETPAAFSRFSLTMREIYFSGVLSLVIILVSGLFVGMVLALQGYDVLQRYGAAESLGPPRKLGAEHDCPIILVGISLCRTEGFFRFCRASRSYGSNRKRRLSRFCGKVCGLGEVCRGTDASGGAREVISKQ